MIIGLFTQIQAYEVYWNVEPVCESGDTVWVNVTLYSVYRCEENHCTPREYSKLVVTPCPFDSSCADDAFVLERQEDIFSAVTQLKLSRREKY